MKYIIPFDKDCEDVMLELYGDHEEEFLKWVACNVPFGDLVEAYEKHCCWEVEKWKSGD